MISFSIRRLAYALLTFFGITIATFTLIHAVPGDPISFFIGRAGLRTIPADTLAIIRAEFHLDEPLPQQYLHWLRGAVTLDFGKSIVDRRPVSERILEKLPATLELNIIAFVLAAAIGVPIGLWSAVRSGRPAERISALALFFLYSLPSFWVALLLIQWFSVRLELLPLMGMSSDQTGEGWSGFTDHLRHLILPVVTLTYAQIAVLARFSKSAMAEVIRQDFVTAARARGVKPSALLWSHAFRNALIPMVTLFGLSIPYLLSGSVIVEQIFQWDGIGLLYFDSIMARDYPTVMGLTVITALITLMASILTDLLYAAADPRVRLNGDSAS
jgi:peptide/nickel transport system permease protein